MSPEEASVFSPQFTAGGEFQKNDGQNVAPFLFFEFANETLNFHIAPFFLSAPAEYRESTPPFFPKNDLLHIQRLSFILSLFKILMRRSFDLLPLSLKICGMKLQAQKTSPPPLFLLPYHYLFHSGYFSGCRSIKISPLPFSVTWNPNFGKLNKNDSFPFSPLLLIFCARNPSMSRVISNFRKKFLPFPLSPFSAVTELEIIFITVPFFFSTFPLFFPKAHPTILSSLPSTDRNRLNISPFLFSFTPPHYEPEKRSPQNDLSPSPFSFFPPKKISVFSSPAVLNV